MDQKNTRRKTDNTVLLITGKVYTLLSYVNL